MGFEVGQRGQCQAQRCSPSTQLRRVNERRSLQQHPGAEQPWSCEQPAWPRVVQSSKEVVSPLAGARQEAGELLSSACSPGAVTWSQASRALQSRESLPACFESRGLESSPWCSADGTPGTAHNCRSQFTPPQGFMLVFREVSCTQPKFLSKVQMATLLAWALQGSPPPLAPSSRHRAQRVGSRQELQNNRQLSFFFFP